MTYVVIFPRVKRETAMQFLIDRVAFRPNFLTVMQHLFGGQNRGTQREFSSKPLKHSIVKRILVFKR